MTILRNAAPFDSVQDSGPFPAELVVVNMEIEFPTEFDIATNSELFGAKSKKMLQHGHVS